MILAESRTGYLVIPIGIGSIIIKIIRLIDIISKFRIGCRVINLSTVHQCFLYQCRIFISRKSLNAMRTADYRTFKCIGDTGFAHCSPLGSNHQYTVGGFRTIKGGGCRIFQHSDFLNIVRSHIQQLGIFFLICRCKIKIVIHRYVIGKPVYYNQRL